VKRNIFKIDKSLEINSIKSKPFNSMWKGLVNSEFRNRKLMAFSLALITEYHLLFYISIGSNYYIIDAFQSDDPQSNYLYGCFFDKNNSQSENARKNLWLERIMNKFGITTYNTEDGMNFWKFILSPIETSELLGLLGRILGYIAVVDFSNISEISVEEEIETFIT
ncbi:hypothetical protein KKB18_01040, partial [bacterium]|nr:hypothetical protein [bacterium]